MKIKKIFACFIVVALALVGISFPSEGQSFNPLAKAEEDKVSTLASGDVVSPLATYTNVTANKNSRTQAIDIISIHCMAAQWTGKQCADYFAGTSKEASSNYCVGKNGDIACSVPENYRAWTTSSPTNDHRAITIEVASDASGQYWVTDAAYYSLINLLVDICQRNPNLKSGLRWQNNPTYSAGTNGTGINPAEQNMTVHRWYANKSCPGDYLMGKHYDIANQVNSLLADANLKPSVYISDIAERSIIGWSGVQSNWIGEGAEVKINAGKGANAARINYTGEANWMFRVTYGWEFNFKFKMNLLDVGATSGNAATDGNTAFHLIVRDAETLEELFRYKFIIWPDNKNDNRVEAYCNIESGWTDTNAYNQTHHGSTDKWITGIPSYSSEYHLAFNPTDLIMAKYNGNDWLQPVVDRVGAANEVGSGAWFYDQVQKKMANTDYICFDIQGDNGFDKDVYVLVTEVNGQRLANDGSNFKYKDIRTSLVNPQQVMTLGESYEVNEFTSAHIWNDDTGINYSIAWKGAANQTAIAGKTFTPTVSGLYTVTMTAQNEYYGESSQSFAIYVVDVGTVGASIRLKDGSLRFRSKIKKADYEYLKNNGYTVTVGMVIAPTAIDGDPRLGDANVLNVPMVNYVEEGGYILFNAVITNFPAAARNSEICTRAYVKVVKETYSEVEYGALTTRRFATVVADALNDTSETQTDKYCHQVTVNGASKWSQYTQAQIDALKAYQG